MPANYSGNSANAVWPLVIASLVDGDPANAAAWNTPFCKLADQVQALYESSVRGGLGPWQKIASALSAGTINGIGTMETSGASYGCAVVGSAGNTAVSFTGGMSWPTATAVGANAYNTVRGFNGVFFAGGASGALATCAVPAATAFTGRTSNTTGDIVSFAWNGSTGSPVYVGVTGNGKVVRSTNSTVWAEVAVAADLAAVAYGASKFVALQTSNKHIWTSTDGSTWTDQGVQAAFPTTMFADSMRFGNGVFACFGITANQFKVVWSADGLTWTSVNASSAGAAATAEAGGMAWNGRVFLLLGGESSIPLYMTSPDGKTWTTQPNPQQAFGLAGGGSAGLFTAPFSGPVAPFQNGAFCTAVRSGTEIGISAPS